MRVLIALCMLATGLCAARPVWRNPRLKPNVCRVPTSVDCKALRAVRSARSARQSHLQDFALTPEALRVLPPTVALAISDEEIARVRQAESAGQSWAEYAPSAKAEAAGPDAIRVEDETTWVRLELYARADFNGDGVEDLLIRADGAAKGGTYRSSRLLLLTRATSGGTMRVAREYR